MVLMNFRFLELIEITMFHVSVFFPFCFVFHFSSVCHTEIKGTGLVNC